MAHVSLCLSNTSDKVHRGTHPSFVCFSPQVACGLIVSVIHRWLELLQDRVKAANSLLEMIYGEEVLQGS